MSFIEKLDWRYATKKFDPKKEVSGKDAEKIMEAIRMAPTSFGFQPFHVDIIESKDLREELKKNAWNQSQFTDASLLFVFSIRTDLMKRVDEYIELLTGGDAKQKEAMGQYIGMMKGSASGMDETKAKAWAAKQTYIALGFGLAAALELDLDSCPMEGFNPDEFKKVLNLPENLYPVVSLAVGYRATDDAAAKKPKVRFAKEELFSKK